MKNQQKSSRTSSFEAPEANVRLETLSEKDLLARAKKAIQKERYWTNVLINHLLECERRGIHLKRNYSSLHEFAVHYLGLSDGGAHRRIHAMHLMRNIPETEEKLASGKLSLSKAAKLQTFFNAEAKSGSPMSKREQFEWIERAEPMSSRDLDRAILASASNKAQVLLGERVRSISPDLSEVRWVVPNTLLEKIDQLKSLIYQNGMQTPSQELIGKLIDEELQRQRKRRFGNASEKEIDSPEETAPNRSKGDSKPPALESMPPDASSVGIPPPALLKSEVTSVASERPKASPSKRKPIPAALRRRVWNRAKGQCEFREPNSVQTNFPARCSARRSLQIDHIIPISEGGNDDPSNLRLLCGSHNRLRVPAFL
jgi:hypothetical protein